VIIGSNGANSEILNKYEDRVRVSNTDPGWEDMWPTETRGDGNVKRNNYRTGGAQGKGTLLRKISCRLCGFLNDATAQDHSGGSIDGEGAMGQITTAVVSFPVSAPPSPFGNATVSSENIGTQVTRKGSGCQFCGSKNYTSLRVIFDNPDPLNSPLLEGF
jgi:hypothetical protein